MSKKIFVLLMSIVSLVSCAHQRQKFVNQTNDLVHVWILKDKEEIPDKKIDPELAPFIPSFVYEAKIRGYEILPDTIDRLKQLVYVDKFSTAAEPGVLGVCTRYYTYETTPDGEKKERWYIIEILEKEAKAFSEGEPSHMEELVFHELFHCFMNKGHLPDGVPGLMAPVLDKSNMRMAKDRENLLNETFSQKYLDLIPNATSSSAN